MAFTQFFLKICRVSPVICQFCLSILSFIRNVLSIMASCDIIESAFTSIKTLPPTPITFKLSTFSSFSRVKRYFPLEKYKLYVFLSVLNYSIRIFFIFSSSILRTSSVILCDARYLHFTPCSWANVCTDCNRNIMKNMITLRAIIVIYITIY